LLPLRALTIAVSPCGILASPLDSSVSQGAGRNAERCGWRETDGTASARASSRCMCCVCVCQPCCTVQGAVALAAPALGCWVPLCVPDAITRFLRQCLLARRHLQQHALARIPPAFVLITLPLPPACQCACARRARFPLCVAPCQSLCRVDPPPVSPSPLHPHASFHRHTFVENMSQEYSIALYSRATGEKWDVAHQFDAYFSLGDELKASLKRPSTEATAALALIPPKKRFFNDSPEVISFRTQRLNEFLAAALRVPEVGTD
jgi:hypothetical protein